MWLNEHFPRLQRKFTFSYEFWPFGFPFYELLFKSFGHLSNGLRCWMSFTCSSRSTHNFLLCSMSLGATQMDCSHGFPDPLTSALEPWRALEGETEGGREGGKGGGVGGWVFSSSILSLLSHEGLTVSFDPRSQLLAGSCLQQLFLFLSSRNCYLSLSF